MKCDTIAAIATPTGSGGIGIIKISGKDAFSIYIATGNQSPVRIDFPNHSTHYTARLQQRLTLILGARSVRLEN